jgi:hypothetical protein
MIRWDGGGAPDLTQLLRARITVPALSSRTVRHLPLSGSLKAGAIFVDPISVRDTALSSTRGEGFPFRARAYLHGTTQRAPLKLPFPPNGGLSRRGHAYSRGRLWLDPANRCLVPFKSFANTGSVDARSRVAHAPRLRNGCRIRKMEGAFQRRLRDLVTDAIAQVGDSTRRKACGVGSSLRTHPPRQVVAS